MDWTSLLDSLVKQFTDHHDDPVLNGWKHNISTDGTVSQQGTRVRQDQEGMDFGIAGKRFENSDQTPTPELSKPGKGVWEVTPDPWRLTRDRMTTEPRGYAGVASDTPYNPKDQWNTQNGIMMEERKGFLPLK